MQQVQRHRKQFAHLHNVIRTIETKNLLLEKQSDILKKTISYKQISIF